MPLEKDIEPELLQKLASLQSVPDRDPAKEELGLAAFIREADGLLTGITPQPEARHKGWMHALRSLLMNQRKERSPMINTLATILLITSLILGGGGATVAAAQTSQPDQPLYGVKLLSEDVRIGLAADPAKEAQLAMEFAGRRAAEIALMLQKGIAPSQAVQLRYQSQIELAVRSAARLSDEQAVKLLAQMRIRLQEQQQLLLQIQENGSPAVAAVNQIRQMLQERLQWIETGLGDPAKLREELRLREQDQNKVQQKTPSSEPQASKTVPGSGAGNPWTTGTPTPGSGYGPGQGTGECEACTPAYDGQGSNPWTTGTPTPGSGYGPGQGTGPTDPATPGAGSGSGPQPTPWQMNQPTQAGPQPTQGAQGTAPGPQATATPHRSGGKP